MPTPFKPASGGKPIVPGCSDKTPRSLFLAEQQATNQAGQTKLTTASRASAAVEQYWTQQQDPGTTNSSSSSTGASTRTADTLPGGERELAHKTRDTCWHDSVHLGHQPGPYIPECRGTPRDIEEKEVGRTRGIPGYTGCQPPPGATRPPALPPPVEVSRWTAIDAFDERRPRLKGIPGYTGHQPHASTPGSPALAQPQQATQLKLSLPSTHGQHPAPAAAACTSSTTAGADPGQAWPSSAHSAQHDQRQASPAVAGYPQSALYCSTAGSRISSPPRYFCDGVEVPVGLVPVPPGSAAAAAATVAPPQSAAAAAGVQPYPCSSNSGSTAADRVTSSGGGRALVAYSSGPYGSQGRSRAQGAGQVEAEVMVVQPEAEAVSASGQGRQASPAAHTMVQVPQQSQQQQQQQLGAAGGVSGLPGGGVARVGRPAIGPWCTTYSTTFVQQEAFKGLMDQLKGAALQRQQHKAG